MNIPISDIVITGSAVISAAGIGTAAIQELVRTGGNALTPMPAEVLGRKGLAWGKTTTFKVSDFMPPLKARKMDRCSQFAVAAAGMALKEAGIDLKATAPERVGIALGSGFCGLANSAEFLSGYFTGGVEGLMPMLFPNTVPNAPASNASIEHGFTGPNVTVVQRFCSAESAFLLACRHIEEGRADVMLTGGADELIPILVRGFAALGQVRGTSAPFGEGCGMIVLESADHARRRGAVIRAAVDHLRTIGMLIPGHEQEGLELLCGPERNCSLVSLSGNAADMPGVMAAVGGIPTMDVGRAIGRSLAMGGTALATLIASLPAGARGLHMATSPEGPCFSIDILGGSPV
ncbi:beta-ketoacyl synthase N-terminal-like domain-containing protein [Geobacter sp. SVR]|uniref:beta-ketoacyl synthase N-terminal-like domain-containing protein n=1 Tax=Geobacter sp. SVR TaxID=2495594 RepID=UPI00143F030F|nr:beta-ketoacyl synthase N-terminal-like domain-containing protein [Geobacter sp. SVR]BCS54295.1 beta-ketoacyl synthase [Geobacter sp. SVR]GCF85846.1 beta-ketoacyl synthase [Geobacter sp. SVR]